MNNKGGWYLVPAAFLFIVHFSLSPSLFAVLDRSLYLLLLVSLFLALRRIDLSRIEPVVVAGVGALLFAYGLAQRFWLFPQALRSLPVDGPFFRQALAARLRSGRIFTVFPLPTLYAMVCGVLLLFLLDLFLRARGGGKFGWAALALLGLANLVLTQSFGGVLFFLAGALFYLFTSRQLPRKWLPPVVMVLSLLLFLVIALRYSEARRLDPARLRLANWAQAVRLIESSPWLGVGLGNYGNRVAAVTLPGEPQSIYAHNFPLQLAAETGVIPALLLLAAAGLLLWRRRRFLLEAGQACLSAVLVLIVLHNLIDIGVYFLGAGLALVWVLARLFPAGRRDWSRAWLGVALGAGWLLWTGLTGGWARQGDVYLAQGERAAARVEYERSLRGHPLSPRPLLPLAELAMQEGDLTRARELLERATAAQPGLAYARSLHAQLALRQGRFACALREAGAAQVNALRPDYRNAFEKLSNELAKQIQTTRP
ncbi:MAG TPA: O-antigen ligase family protein [Candidatus Aminicenantes bacterium]|nr:O-antigen ligase family protein [Candidatus Aminicenantes bacterium]